MKGATPEALEQLRNGLLGILQSAAEQENAHEAALICELFLTRQIR